MDIVFFSVIDNELVLVAGDPAEDGVVVSVILPEPLPLAFAA